MGPMRAARRFAVELNAQACWRRSPRSCRSLRLAGAHRAWATEPIAPVLLGLSGEEAATIDPASIEPKLAAIRSSGTVVDSGLACRPVPRSRAPAFPSRPDDSAGSGDATSQRRALQRVRCGRHSAADAHLLFDWRRLHRGRWRGCAADQRLRGVAMPYPFSSAAEMLQHGRRTRPRRSGK